MIRPAFFQQALETIGLIDQIPTICDLRLPEHHRIIVAVSGGGGEQRGRERDPLRFLAARLGLSSRQAEVFALLVQGRSRLEVAGALGCSKASIDEHVRRICRKARQHGVPRGAHPRFDDVVRALLLQVASRDS